MERQSSDWRVGAGYENSAFWGQVGPYSVAEKSLVYGDAMVGSCNRREPVLNQIRVQKSAVNPWSDSEHSRGKSIRYVEILVNSTRVDANTSDFS